MMNRKGEPERRAPQRGLRRHIGGIALPEPIDQDEAERMWLPNVGIPEEKQEESES